jgi:hypothetical protein
MAEGGCVLDCALPTTPTTMEPNQIDNALDDLSARVAALRGYL